MTTQKTHHAAAHVLESQIPEHLQQELKLQLSNLPSRYFQSLDLPGVKADLTLTERLPSERVVVSTTEHNGRLTLRVLMAKDEPKIFLRVAAILARHKISIDSASIFTGAADGMVLDHFVLQEPVDRDILEPLMAETRSALRTGVYEPPILRPALTKGMRISVENMRNTDHTTVALIAPDQVGFLYRVAQVFDAFSLDLKFAKIRTQNGQIHDTFHVVNTNGPLLMREQRALSEALAKSFA